MQRTRQCVYRATVTRRLLPFVIAMGVGARAIVWLGPIDKVHESLLSPCRTYDSAKRGLRYSADLSVARVVELVRVANAFMWHATAGRACFVRASRRLSKRILVGVPTTRSTTSPFFIRRIVGVVLTL